MPSVRPKKTHAHPVSHRHRLARPRAVLPKASAGQSRVVELIADLLKDRNPPDDNEARCFELIRRFHRWGRRDTCHALRLVSAPVVEADGKPNLTVDGHRATRRYVWELACLEYQTGPEWKVIAWGIDEESAYFQPHSSEQAARAAFHRSPEPEAHRPH